MKWKLSIILLLTVTQLKAQVAPQQVEEMLKQMVNENVISATEAEKTKLRMKSMAEQWAELNKTAAKIAARTPASVTPSGNRIEELHEIDLDGAQFKSIQEQVRKIVPRYQD